MCRQQLNHGGRRLGRARKPQRGPGRERRRCACRLIPAYYLSNETIYCLLPEMLLAAVATFIFVGGACARVARHLELGGGRRSAGGHARAVSPIHGAALAAGRRRRAALVRSRRRSAGGRSAGPIRPLARADRGPALRAHRGFQRRDVQAPEYAGSLLVAITGLMLVARRTTWCCCS